MNIILDSNVLFSALIKDSATRKIILKHEEAFLFPEFIFEEMEKHKEELLQKSGFYGKTLINTSGGGVRERISWTQTSRSWTGNTEVYQECDYKIEGEEGSVVKVFVAAACGPPPAEFNTAGHEQGDGPGVLHFGYVFADDDPAVKAIFFVIHPNSWGPYQHRFRTTGMLALVQTGVGEVGGAAAGAAIGSLFAPGIGTAVGAGAGWVVTKVTPSFAGQYLRFIGSG